MAAIEKTNYCDEKTMKVLEALNNGHGCTRCGKCCTEQVLGVLGSEAVKIARFLGIPGSEFREAYVERQVGKWLLIRKREDHCPFLQKVEGGTRCNIYPVRPQTCIRFPWLTAEIMTRSKFPNIVGNDGMCPEMSKSFTRMTEGSH